MSTIIFFAIVFLVLGLMNYYIYRRAIQALEYVSVKWRVMFRVIFIITVPSYILSKALFINFSGTLYEIFHAIGSYWFAYLIYLLLLLLLIDLSRLINRFVKIYPLAFYENPAKTKFYAGIAVFLSATIILFFGWLNMQTITVTNVQISLPKKSSQLDSLHIVFFSDSHFSVIHDKDFTARVVDVTNNLNADIILLGGDIVDEPEAILNNEGIDKELRRLTAPMGVFGIMGNHEYIVDGEETAAFLSKNGVIMLRDTVITIDSLITLIGREDRSKQRETGSGRKSLEELTNNISRDFPIILMDHQPFELQETADAQIDFQLSGHTHNGQWFPGNILVDAIYENPYGLSQKEKTQFFVSSGAATWGPPIKIGAKAEVVSIHILFK
jgi:predicted MPP superfamily phosphohydrolase